MVKRYAKQAGLPDSICCHTFRGTGITIALEHGATLEEAQRLASHSGIRTTMLYDRRDKTVKRGVVERIVIWGDLIDLRSCDDNRMISKSSAG